MEDWHSNDGRNIDFIWIFGIIVFKSKGKTIERWRRKAIGTNDEMRLHPSMSASCDQPLKKQLKSKPDGIMKSNFIVPFFFGTGGIVGENCENKGGIGMELEVRNENRQRETEKKKEMPVQIIKRPGNELTVEYDKEQKMLKIKIWTPLLVLPGLTLLGIGGLLLIIGMPILCLVTCIIGAVLFGMSNLSDIQKEEEKNDSIDREIEKRIG